jgi:adenine C2-methylase RlmN of 23S rRNA A2503 and tRNA A37
VFTEIKNVNVNKLINEFINKGIKVIKVEIIDENTSVFEFEEGQDETLINSIVKNHDPVIVDTPSLQERINALENLLMEVF